MFAEPGGKKAYLVRGSSTKVSDMTHVVPLEQDGGVYYLHAEASGYDQGHATVRRRQSFCDLPLDIDVQPIDLGNRDARDPEAAEVERTAQGRDDINVSGDDFRDINDDEPEERQSALPQHEVKMPSVQQKEAHELAGHPDYAPWCESCAAGKARARPHRRARADIVPTPTVIANCSFLTVGDGMESGLKLLCARFRRTGSVFANSCVCKGASDRYLVAAMAT